MHLLACAVVALSASPAAQPAAPSGKPITLGIAQPYGEEQAKKAKAIIEPYLSKQLNSTVTVVIHPTYDELTDALANSKVDLAWITPLAFVHAADKNADVTALSKAMRQGGGGLYYRAVFITRKGSPLKTLGDLKGKKVAWVNKSSTSGYLFPRELLKKNGVDPDKFFSEEIMAGDHTAVCKAVKEGKADVGATFAQDVGEGKIPRADGCADSGGAEQFDVVAQTGSIPNEVLASRPDFTSDRKRTNRVISTFGRMGSDDEGKKLLRDAFHVDGWGIAVDGDFDPVIDLVRPKNKKAKVAPADTAQ
jgi:phosphonate transport system substrate-binding protein